MPDFLLFPYVGARPILFDMSVPDVERVVGPPVSVGTTYYGKREEWRGPVSIRYSKFDQRVIDIAFLPQARLFYEGVDLFRKDDLIGFLSQYDQPYESVGFVVFLTLGITVTGFHDNDESQKAIVAFKNGRMDEFRGDLTPL